MRVDKLYDFKSEEEYDRFLEQYGERKEKSSKQQLLTDYERNHFVRAHTCDRETRHVCNKKIQIIKSRFNQLFN